jgi:UDP-N-acetylmuramate: L-alanyl-gamma-D-glutamyl-meso-diaminopimelate ligase
MAADASSAARLARLPAAVRHVHLIGAGGTAMAALAQMLAHSGYRVTGSDTELYEPTLSLLRNSRVELMRGFSAANLAPAPDLVVVGNVIVRTNPEAVALLDSRIAYISMPEALWHFFLREHRVLMVAGTHGKTTSTAMMAQVIAAAGRDPSMMVGGVAKNFGTNFRIGAGRDFVIEGDEYDTAFFDKGPKFLHYHAAATMVTAVEFDHADIYRDLDHVKSSFRALAEQMEPDAVMAVCADFPHALDSTANTRARRVTYGFGAADYRAMSIATDACGSRFSVERDGAIAAAGVHLPIGGRMNVANALGVFALLTECGMEPAQIASGLGSFAGVVRRQEIVGEAAGVTIIDDFGHHPTAIAVTLSAIAERFAGGRIIAAFEPRSNTSRRNVFQGDFARAFDAASRVYLGPVYFKDNDPIPASERLDTKALAREISARGPVAFACESNAEIVELIDAEVRAGDVVVFMSNGPFDGLKDKLVAKLRARDA